MKKDFYTEKQRKIFLKVMKKRLNMQKTKKRFFGVAEKLLF